MYKERLTDNSQLTKAARLAAQEAALLTSEDIPPAMKQALVKPLSRDVLKWTKAVRRPVWFGNPGGSDGGSADDEESDVEGKAFTQRSITDVHTFGQKEEDPRSQTPTVPAPKAKKRLRFLPLIPSTQKKKKKTNPVD